MKIISERKGKGKMIRFMVEKNKHWWKDPSIASFVSFRNIPFCLITRAGLGACARASSRAVFHSYKSSDVSA
jgi:hypothetical protein